VFGDVGGANDDIGGGDEQWACPDTHFVGLFCCFVSGLAVECW
jgi:hypothetical protein